MSAGYASVCPAPLETASHRRVLKIVVAALLALSMAAYFWIDSRYPALLKKLHAGTTLKVAGAISFDAKLPVTGDMPLLIRVERTTVNWMWTNRIGMSFGVCFGAAALTLLPLLSRRRFKSAAGNTLLGALIGAPLGVCANCVAPIGQGMFSAGASTSTVLGTMITSPLLNVVVLAMAFTLFPLPIALTRLAIPLVLLALVPVIAHQDNPGLQISPPEDPRTGDWTSDVGTIAINFLKNLARLAAITVPLMVAAAVLGALVIESVPAQSIPMSASIVGVFAIALIGTFLPVPMAFDVAAAFLLMSRGVPMPYVVALLCTLGAFSIYPFLIVGRGISWRTASAMFGAVALLGTMAGLATGILQHAF